MRTNFPVAFLGFCLSALSVQGATITATSPSFSAVSAAVASAARGDTVQVPDGSADWGTNTLLITKGLTLKTEHGRDSTFITGTGPLIGISPDSTAIADEETIRVEGFTFDGNNTASYHISIWGSGPTATKPFKNLAIGSNRFKNSTTTTSGNGAINSLGQVRGAIFNNIFDRCNVIIKIMGNDNVTEWANGHFPFAYGNSDNLFFENNTIMYSSTFNGQDPGWTEIGQGARCVIRYSTWDLTNAPNSTEIFDIHGFQNWPGNGQTGTMIAEYYGNTITNAHSFRLLNHRGSWGLFYNNIVTGTGAQLINASQYGVGDSGGSGCTTDVPGASGVYVCEINNTYVFNNPVNGTIVNMTPGSVFGCGIAENNNFYNYNASFNGSTGIGRGTTAPSMSATNGVGYWRCSTPTPTINPADCANRSSV